MTREELYASIYTHDTIYLPPWEEQSAPLEVALGCSWGKCRFCDFAKDTFSLHSDEKIEENLKILSKLQPENPRVFFLGENAFVIESERLLRLFSLVPVSYTHLDVYKRQRFASSLTMTSKCCSPIP